MKKVISLLCIASLLCALILPVGSEGTPVPTRNANIFDALDILKNIVGMVELSPIEKYDHNEDGVIDIFDALEVLKGLVGMRTAVQIPPPPCSCGVEDCTTEWEAKEFMDPTVTIDTPFCGKTVLLVLDKKIGRLDKVHDPSFFGSFPIEGIHDLTPSFGKIVENDPELRAYLGLEGLSAEEINMLYPSGNSVTWRQILSIRLPTDCKQNVLDVIAILEKVDGVRSAEPNYIWIICCECMVGETCGEVGDLYCCRQTPHEKCRNV
jgi:hypothetical protein